MEKKRVTLVTFGKNGWERCTYEHIKDNRWLRISSEPYAYATTNVKL